MKIYMTMTVSNCDEFTSYIGTDAEQAKLDAYTQDRHLTDSEKKKSKVEVREHDFPFDIPSEVFEDQKKAFEKLADYIDEAHPDYDMYEEALANYDLINWED